MRDVRSSLHLLQCWRTRDARCLPPGFPSGLPTGFRPIATSTCACSRTLNVIDALRARGTRLALVTNGASEAQRAKIARFDLANRFDHIQLEGEHAFGKPDERAYLFALRQLGADPRDTWVIGDNLEWEVAAPQRLGIFGIWFDAAGKGLPRDTHVKPDRIVASLSELLPTDVADGA